MDGIVSIGSLKGAPVEMKPRSVIHHYLPSAPIIRPALTRHLLVLPGALIWTELKTVLSGDSGLRHSTQ